MISDKLPPESWSETLPLIELDRSGWLTVGLVGERYLSAHTAATSLYPLDPMDGVADLSPFSVFSGIYLQVLPFAAQSGRLTFGPFGHRPISSVTSATPFLPIDRMYTRAALPLFASSLMRTRFRLVPGLSGWLTFGWGRQILSGPHGGFRTDGFPSFRMETTLFYSSFRPSGPIRMADIGHGTYSLPPLG